MGYKNTFSVQTFNEVYQNEFFDQQRQKIWQEIERSPKEYILGIDEGEFLQYLKEKYTLEPLAVDLDTEAIDKPDRSKEWVSNHLGHRYQIDTYNFSIHYKFSGDAQIFRIHPSTRTVTTTQILVNDTDKIVTVSFKLRELDKGVFDREKNNYKIKAFKNVGNANNDVRSYNNSLPSFLEQTFRFFKAKYLKENDFFAAINVKVNSETGSLFTAPTLQKKIIPQPLLPKGTQFSSEPTMSLEMYEDVLKVIYQSGKGMEKKPALYRGKDEEGLRDQFLFVLENRYDATTVTGETFNRSGKTDILLKYQDGTNLFIAECKFWKGAAEYLKAISQLFDRYLTWRDSKVAILIFSKNKQFTEVLAEIDGETKKHPYYIRPVGKKGESRFSYIFRLPQDTKKEVLTEIIAFNYDK